MRRLLNLCLPLLALAACTDADATPESADAPMAVATSARQASTQELPTVLVYKTPTCGCCSGWVEHMQAEGFTVDARDVSNPDLIRVKQDGGVPGALSSCHTAIVDGYLVEGHVPAEQIRQLLADRPDVAGIAVPGMPIGSPGMEGPGARPYEVLAFTRDGRSSVFAEVDPR